MADRPPVQVKEFECLRVHPYSHFSDGGGCGARWHAPQGPSMCNRCGNIYVKDVTDG